MAKNLIHCLSPVTIGLKVQPNIPTSANIRSGHMCRLGDVFGVCVVDHYDSLAGGTQQTQQSTDRASTTPVINFGLNVWEFEVYRLTAVSGAANYIKAGAIIYYVEGGSGTGGVETDSGYALILGEKPVASSALSGVISGTSGETLIIRQCGVLVEDLNMDITAGSKVKAKVLVGNNSVGSADVELALS